MRPRFLVSNSDFAFPRAKIKIRFLSSDFQKNSSPGPALASEKTPRNALHLACHYKRLDILKILLEDGRIDVNALDGEAKTPLIICIRLSMAEPYWTNFEDHGCTSEDEDASNWSGLELNNKNNQVSVGIRNRVFGTIFYKFHAKISRFRHNFDIFHDFFPTFIIPTRFILGLWR